LARAGATPVYAAIDGRAAAVIGVSDPVKPSARAAIAALHARGVKTAMITGDAQATANAIAADLGIDHVVAEVLPEGKVAAVEELMAHGRLAFVGDGINDAPALARADIGIAIGTGTDVAIEAADVVLMSGDVAGVVNALEISRRTMGNIRQNLFWAFGYNVLLIPVAAGVLAIFGGPLLSPILAAAAMALSSVFVVSNALRLRFVRGAA
ncbi:ATPase, partial [Rhodovulum sp. NI22]